MDLDDFFKESFWRIFRNLIYTPPIAIESYRDITTNIPNKFLASEVPMAPPSIRFSDFSSSSDSSQELTDIYPG